MHFHDPKERPTKELAPGVLARTFWGDKMLLSVVDLDPGAEVPRHTHPHEQGGMVIEGEVEFEIAGDTRLLKPGDIYVIPGDVEHWAKAGASRVKVLDIFSPVREEFKY